jgi:predicted nuclease with RNAse H fold
MNSRVKSSSFYIGWDVGGWNCDKNPKSRDALVILDAGLNIVGKPWRGNLRAATNEAADSTDWISKLFALCKAPTLSGRPQMTLAIDTPLGFSEEFTRLVTQRIHAGEVGNSATNPYLFRQTERFLFEHGLTPLSAIKDMIGSQATKGMHVLAKFAPTVERCGVWSDGVGLIVIEAYPSACKTSETVKGLQQPFGKLAHDDLDDALTCALLAYLFDTHRDKLLSPGASVPVSEGWIWVPKDGLPPNLGITESRI